MNANSTSRVEVWEVFTKLTDGFSTQTKVATKFWLALAIISLFSVAPIPTNSDTGATVELELPFGLAKIPSSEFYPFAAALIAIITIGFGSSLLQAQRSRKVLQRLIDSNEAKFKLPGNLVLQDICDSISSPSMNRVAPIAQVLQGSHQFFPESIRCPRWKRSIAALYYAVLKFVNILVIYAFPGYALASSFIRGKLLDSTRQPWGIGIEYFWFVCLIAGIVLLQLVISDIIYTSRAMKRIALRFRG